MEGSILMFVGIRIRNPQIVNNLKDVQKRIATKFPEVSSCLINPNTFHITLIPPTHPLFENHFNKNNKERKEEKKKHNEKQSQKKNPSTFDLVDTISSDNQNNDVTRLSGDGFSKVRKGDFRGTGEKRNDITSDQPCESSVGVSLDPVEVFQSLPPLEIEVPYLTQNNEIDLSI